MRRSLLAAALGLATLGVGAAAPPATFRNPIFPGTGQDPSVLRWNGTYYLVQSRGGNIRIFASPTLTGLGKAQGVRVWWDGKDGSARNEMWAPELVAIGGKFYIYVAMATGGVHESRRIYVLEADRPTGPYRFKGKVAAPTDLWAIDASVLDHGGEHYLVWSGWKDNRRDQGQGLYIARLAKPWTIAGERHLISSPDQPWERIGPEPINEGPEALTHAGRLFIVYSASHSLTDDYCLGTLTYNGTGEVTDRRSWTKSAGCVFSKNITGQVYGPGHNSLTLSPDGTQTWNVYHAIATSGCGWKCRTIRMQPVKWRADGTPDFGVPAPLGEPLAVPSGE